MSDTTTTTTKPIKVGFVGLSTKGWASTYLGPSLIAPNLRDKYTLTSVTTTSIASATESADKWTAEIADPEHKVKAYGGTDQLLQHIDNDQVDLVAVSVKTPLHRDVVLPFIKAKKDFFLEWPAGRSPAVTREIAEEAKKNGVRSLVGLQGRHSPLMNKVKDLITSGKIGKVLSTNFIGIFPRELRQWAPEAPNTDTYVLDPANGATLLTVPGGHHLDTFTYVLGQDFTNISATGTKHYPITTFFDAVTKEPTGETQSAPAGPDHITYTGVLTDGALATVTWRSGVKGTTPGRLTLLWEIDGEEGSIKIQSSNFLGSLMSGVFAEVLLNGEKVEIPEEAAFGGIGGYLGKNWEEYAKGEGVGNYATIDDAVRIKRVIEAVEESLATGKRVTI